MNFPRHQPGSVPIFTVDFAEHISRELGEAIVYRLFESGLRFDQIQPAADILARGEQLCTWHCKHKQYGGVHFASLKTK
jgi:hypothetical protein